MSRSRKQTLAVALVALLAIAGCSSLPTAPVLSKDSTAARSDGIIVGGGGDIEVPPITTLPAPPVPPVPPVPGVVDSSDVEIAKIVDGAAGGHMEKGRVSLEIPRGAFFGAAQIRITVPDSSSLRCKLEITAGKNGFDQPVTLRFDARGRRDIELLGVFWHNEVTDEWELVDSFSDPETGIVQAQLSHFSEYRVDQQFRSKAGW